MSHTGRWRVRSLTGLLTATVALQTAAGCAYTPPERLRVAPARLGVVTRLADLRLEPGTMCFVTLVSGRSVHGRLMSVTPSELVLAEIVDGAADRRSALAEADIARVARVAGMSRPARSCIGASVAALLSLPLSISRVGDMMVPAAILGSLLGRGTGDSRLEVVLQR